VAFFVCGIEKVQRTEIFVAMVRYPRFEGAAHRNIKFNVTVRCTFNLDFADFLLQILRCAAPLYESPICKKGQNLLPELM
jgi:hypothetical protein